LYPAEPPPAGSAGILPASSASPKTLWKPEKTFSVIRKTFSTIKKVL
jgi:hypothetical protein